MQKCNSYIEFTGECRLGFIGNARDGRKEKRKKISKGSLWWRRNSTKQNNITHAQIKRKKEKKIILYISFSITNIKCVYIASVNEFITLFETHFQPEWSFASFTGRVNARFCILATCALCSWCGFDWWNSCGSFFLVFLHWPMYIRTNVLWYIHAYIHWTETQTD